MKKLLFLLPVFLLTLVACTRSAEPASVAAGITKSIQQLCSTGYLGHLVPPAGGDNADYRKAAAALGDITVVAKASGEMLGTLRYPFTKAQHDAFLSTCYARAGGYDNASVRQGVTVANGIILSLAPVGGGRAVEATVEEQPEAILAALGTPR